MFNMEHQKSSRLIDKLARELGSDIHTWLEDVEIKENMLP